MKKTLIYATVIAISALMISCGQKKADSMEEAVESTEMVENVTVEEMANPEMASIEQYMQENNLTAEPTAEGLYIVVKEQGNGPKIEMGNKVKMNYTGKLLNGKVFDSSVKEVAEAAGIADPRRTYEPMEYVVGEASLIQGWEQGVMGQAEGSKLQLVFPSTLGYGANEIPGLIPSNSPLTFEIEIVEVK